MELKKFLQLLTKPFVEREFNFYFYHKFLEFISGDQKIKIIPLREFKEMNLKDKISLSIRHDIDSDFENALKMAKIEYRYGIRTTYFVLHTANYYSFFKNGIPFHREKLVPLLKKLQDDYGHEIGFHNNLITLEIKYNINPVSYLKRELDWLRENGIKISGTAAHGATECEVFKYHNCYFFRDFPEEIEGFPNRQFVCINGIQKIISKANLKDFGLDYEAYHIPHDRYFSDARMISKGKRWHPNCIDWKEIHLGEKVIILIHPDHWANSIGHKYIILLKRFLNKIKIGG